MPKPLNHDITTLPVWSQRLAAAVDTASCTAIPALLLMEHAGIEIYTQALAHGATTHKIIVLVGSGNNGGDALVAARLLYAHRPEVVLLTDKPRSELAVQQLRIYTAVTQTNAANLLYRPERLTQITDRNVLIIDGLVGLGWRGEPHGTMREIITTINAMPHAKVLAIDLPSGLAADGSTHTQTTVQADMTITFGARKAAHVLSTSRTSCGTVHVADIGFPPHCVHTAMQAHPPQLRWVDPKPLQTSEPFAALPHTAHKYQRGHVLIIGGSRGKHGAPLLSGLAALRAGAGLVSVALDHQNTPPQPLPLELMYEHFFRHPKVDTPTLARFVTARRVRVIVIGPGTVDAIIDDQLWQFLQKYTATGGFVVIDAAAVDGALMRPATRGILLTPHPGEWTRLATPTLPHPHTLTLCAEVKRLAVAQGVHLVYKSTCPLLFTPHSNDPTYACDTGDNSLAKAGSGDVLCGLIAAYLLALRSVMPAFFTAYTQLSQRAKLLSSQHGRHNLLPSDLL